ncbi:ABC transporter ATP-binding protein [Flavobacterium degerlachei]|jgi:lipopolysaccharide transport system ATP-binding protein|uniref:Lipopolysaccharide transport system ATP-binding protein n=1 Tax=Flavobacterium degerlachei TaxID=229203 RepID=A0A1H2VTL7_9FLAO|nr:ABC transporter ATP-binding protein [Flavobacterium degerlachei]SDW71616.1 lipopolysaccharide transport system ATP-binding protein [Flavobacterium degerlachei]
MKGEVLIKAENVSKKFAKSLKKSLYYGVLDLISGITGKDQNKTIREDEFWAVKDISFEVRRGECLGLIGHNGAGKSTLLKMLNGLIGPDEGTITIKGKIGALIELGAGFNPILTGRENIYNNAAVIGFSKQEIEAKFEAIIAFSELEEFIDMPVQNYSSGMKVRLGFAIAAQMEPDVLIIDEVLAVGDLGFVLKCFKQIDKLIPNTAIIFVSHSMPMISRICSQVILLERGRVDFQGIDVAKGVNKYYGKFTNNTQSILLDDKVIEDFEFKIEADKNTINWNDDFKFTISFVNLKLTKMPYFSISLFDKENKPIALMYYKEKSILIEKRKYLLDFCHKKMQLSRGVYSINVTVNQSFNNNIIYRINNVQQLFVDSEIEDLPTFLLETYLTKLN